MLIPLSHDLFVNTDTVRTVARATGYNDGLDRIEVTFADGSRKIVQGSLDNLEWCAGPIIPAPAGYSVVIAFPPEKNGDPTTFMTAPVIGFRVTDREPYPITPWGRIDDHQWALVWPTGQADVQWDRMYDSVDAFKAAFGTRGERS